MLGIDSRASSPSHKRRLPGHSRQTISAPLLRKRRPLILCASNPNIHHADLRRLQDSNNKTGGFSSAARIRSVARRMSFSKLLDSRPSSATRACTRGRSRGAAGRFVYRPLDLPFCGYTNFTTRRSVSSKLQRLHAPRSRMIYEC
jgi:hypothetical protein